MAIALLAILVAAALLNDYYLPIAGRRARLEHLAAPLAFLVLAGWRLARGRLPVRVDAISAFAIGWVAVNALSSVLYAPQLSESVVHVVRMGLLIAIFLTVANLPLRPAAAWTRALRLWLVLGAIAVGYGLLVWLLAQFADVWLRGAYLEPLVPGINIKGTQYERNLFGIFAATLLFVASYLFFAQRAAGRESVASTRLLSGVAALAAIATVLSLTRSAWLAAAATGPAAWILFDRRRWSAMDRPLRQASLALPLVLVLLLGVIRAVPPPHQTQRAKQTMVTGTAKTVRPAPRPQPPSTPVDQRLSSFGSLRSDFTSMTRMQDAKWALEDWRRSPLLGHGTGSFAQLHGTRAGTPAWISNIVLHAMVDTGIVGLIIQGALIVLVSSRAWRAARRTASPDLATGLRSLTFGLLLVLIAYQFTDGSWLALFWIHLALMTNGIYCAADEMHAAPAGRHAA